MNEESLESDSLRQSFSVLLDRCLRLGTKDETLIIYDESLNPYFEPLLDEVRRRAASTTFVFIPKSYQLDLVMHKLSSEEGNLALPAGLVSAILESSVILNLLDGDHATTLVRKAVLQQRRPEQSRLAHIPGIAKVILNILLKSPFDQIEKSSELFAWALGEATQAELETEDLAGKRHVLRMDLGGWDNEPMMSPGTIFEGSWGNIPPGETFCCPDPVTVDGEICINGSVPGHVMAQGEETLLTFEQGKLVDWKCSSPGSPSDRFFDERKQRSEAIHDRNWNTFAELGIGLNPAIAVLTGNPLFDEKAMGTIHIAIGDNHAFGHHIESQIHDDLVTWRPSLRLNGATVIDRGVFIMENLERPRNGVRAGSGDIPENVSFFLIKKKVQALGQGRDRILARKLFKQYRVGFVQMADPKIGRILAQVAQKLDTYNQVKVNEFLTEYPAFEGIQTRELLGTLHHYRVLGTTRF